MEKLMILFFFLISCKTDPQPILAGKDECYQCKMGVVDEKFGAEIITAKGKVYKFDDVICMIKYLKTGAIKDKDIQRTIVINYSKKNEFIDVDNAFFLISNDLHSPMNGNAAAFLSKEEAAGIQQQMKGDILNWSELTIKLK